MPDLAGFGEIAPYLTHPLVLAGVGLLLLFGLLRAVLRSRVVSGHPRRSSPNVARARALKLFRPL